MHGIMELDKGVVQGEDTWHGIESYATQEEAVTIQQARDIMCFPLSKEQLYRDEGFAEFKKVDAWCIIRKDHNKVLVPHVGKKFAVLDNSFLLDFVHEHLLCEFHQLSIESVGTLFNGATAFVNLKVKEFQITGDSSPTINRLMYYNPLGKGSYKACAHDVRIVCNNTLQAAEMQGGLNKSLAKFAHTASAGQKINQHLVDIAEINLGLEKHIEVLEMLTTKTMVSDDLTAFLDHMFPMPIDDNGKPKEGRAATIAQNKRELLVETYMADETVDPPDSAYALLQATTDVIDRSSTRGGDEMSVHWDGITGLRAKTKNKALDFLVKY